MVSLQQSVFNQHQWVTNSLFYSLYVSTWGQSIVQRRTWTRRHQKWLSRMSSLVRMPANKWSSCKNMFCKGNIALSLVAPSRGRVTWSASSYQCNAQNVQNLSICLVSPEAITWTVMTVQARQVKAELKHSMNHLAMCSCAFVLCFLESKKTNFLIFCWGHSIVEVDI